MAFPQATQPYEVNQAITRLSGGPPPQPLQVGYWDWALSQALQGEGVRRKVWTEGAFIRWENGGFADAKEGEKARPHLVLYVIPAIPPRAGESEFIPWMPDTLPGLTGTPGDAPTDTTAQDWEVHVTSTSETIGAVQAEATQIPAENPQDQGGDTIPGEDTVPAEDDDDDDDKDTTPPGETTVKRAAPPAAKHKSRR
jgi:hypothetical protein